MTFETAISWSIAGPGAAFAEGCDTTSDTVVVVYTEGNAADVQLTARVTVTCASGNGYGLEASQSHTVYSPVWDAYHGIYMYAQTSISGPSLMAAGEKATYSMDNRAEHEYDRRSGDGIQTPLDDLVVRWTLPQGFTGSSSNYEIVATAPDASVENATVSAEIDDVPLPKPANERAAQGTTSLIHQTQLRLRLSKWQAFSLTLEWKSTTATTTSTQRPSLPVLLTLD